MEEIESFSKEYKKRLDEDGALGKIPENLALEVIMLCFFPARNSFTVHCNVTNFLSSMVLYAHLTKFFSVQGIISWRRKVTEGAR